MTNKDREEYIKELYTYFECKDDGNGNIAIKKYLDPNIKKENGTISFMKELFIPNNVIEINQSAIEEFSWKNYLEKIIVEKDNLYFESRDSNVIMEKETKTLVLGCVNSIIPNDTKIIGFNAFNNCLRLEKIVLPNGLEEIQSFAFYNCCGLKEINFPNSLKEIGEQVFTSCDRLKILSLPNSIKFIDKAAFFLCGFVNKVNIPNKLTYINESMFEDCSSIKEIVVPKNIKRICESAFEGCEELEKNIFAR